MSLKSSYNGRAARKKHSMSLGNRKTASSLQRSITAKDVMIFMEDPDLDMRRSNAPTVRNEIAAIFVEENGEPPANRDVCIAIAKEFHR
ncbi:hypothetical protein AVEN_15190-1 [Araneus ventricosus]|uniref:Uncharacterized protein n=1 Tax=Araneus ventricosus TaxID=182803 RepID=A0A4Y2QIP6_ARAVE|nr:hypothetical protein AVEN_15190-1 [Araneus ventricosus]